MSLLFDWCSIDSHSHDREGLKAMQRALSLEFDRLGLNKRFVDCEYGQAVVYHRSGSPSFLLGGHYDTVHRKGWPCVEKNGRFYGPGSADMKGGLIILLNVARHITQNTSLGLEIILSCDEEIGSPASRPFWEEAAARNTYGLIFEPTLEDGSLVGARKGSANFSVEIRGESAHVGRNFDRGKSSIYALAELIKECEAMITGDTTVNVALASGVHMVNTVPDVATCQINIRSFDVKEMDKRIQSLYERSEAIGRRRGVTIEINQRSHRPPKPLSDNLLRMLNVLQEIDPQTRWESTGGVCDGNLLGGAGLPTIDTLGVKGGGMHTADEYCVIDSIDEQTAKCIQFVERLCTATT